MYLNKILSIIMNQTQLHNRRHYSVQKSLEKLENGTYALIETPALNNFSKQLIEKHLFYL